MFNKLLAEKDSKLPVETPVVPKNHIQDHEEAVDGACVLQLDLHVQGDAGHGFPPSPDGENSAPREHRPPERAVLFFIVVYGGTYLLKKRLSSKTSK